MAKKPSAIYEPGELEKVRGRLGPVDESEARRIAQKLGGEVGTERSVVTPPIKRPSYVRRDNASGRSGRSGRPMGAMGDDDGFGNTQSIVKQTNDPSDDPNVQLRTTYFERVKMDRYAAQPEFEIKSSLQAFISLLYFLASRLII